MRKKVNRFCVSFLLILSMIASQCVNVSYAFADEIDQTAISEQAESESDQAVETQDADAASIENAPETSDADASINVQADDQTGSTNEMEVTDETKSAPESETVENDQESKAVTESIAETEAESEVETETEAESETETEDLATQYAIRVIETSGSTVDVAESAAVGETVEIRIASDYEPYAAVLAENEVFQDVSDAQYDEETETFLVTFTMPSYDVKVSIFPLDGIMLNSIGDTYTVTLYDERYYSTDPSGYRVSSGYFEVTNGSMSTWAFCCKHEKQAVPAGTTLTESAVYTAENQANETMRKILYYGWKGPAARSDATYVITALAVSVANGHSDNYYGWGQAFINKLASLPAAPSGFNVTMLANSNAAQQDLVFWTYEQIAYLQIEKTFEGGNSAYDPDKDAAVYTIYTDAACTKEYVFPYVGASSFRIESGLQSGVITVEPGTYYVKEVKAPSGWSLDTTVHKVTASGSTTVTNPAKVTSTNTPKKAYLQIEKTFEGGNSSYDPDKDSAIYTIYTDEACTKEYKSPYMNGQSSYRIEKSLKTGEIVVEPGTYYVKETKAPSGWTIDTAAHKVTATESSTLSSPVKVKSTDKIGQGGFYLTKSSANTTIVKDNSCYSLEGAVYGVYSNANCADSAKIGTLTTDKNGKTQTLSVNKGTYYVKETKAPKGYALDTKVHSVTVEAGKTAEVKVTDEPYNDPAGIKITKISAEDADVVSLAGTQFTVCYYEGYYTKDNLPSKATRTWVLEVKESNENGKIVYRVNFADTCKVSGDEFYYDRANNPVIPLGTITIEETKAADGYTLTGGYLRVLDTGETVDGKYVAQITSSNDGAYLVGGNVFTDVNYPVPTLATKAKNSASGTQLAKASSSVTLVDTSMMKRLATGASYELKTTLINRSTGETIKTVDGKSSISTSFKATSADMNVDVSMTIDAGKLSGSDVVFYEELYFEGELIASHKDINDDGQTIHFPQIHTTALDQNTGDHISNATGSISIVDTVNYSNLIVGKTYTVSGTLMDKATGKAALNDAGKEITASETFTAEKSDGSIDVIFTFSGVKLKGKTLVAFETISSDGVEYAAHADINDEGQTVYVPEIHTTALDKSSGSHNILAGKNAVIVDTVAYKNLIVGKEYIVSGTLMDKATGKAVTGADGKAVTSSVKFTAEKTSGSVDVTYTFDASALENKTLVVFENISLNGRKVAVHEDLNDEDQTIYVPQIQTTALGKDTKDHNILAEKNAVIVDTVAYKNLIVGKEYTITGTLMDKATGKAVTGADGKAVTSSVKFTAEKSNGSAEIEFTFDASALAGTTIVAFESVTTNGKEVGIHADLEDEGQTVYVPEIHTTALDKSSASHNIIAAQDVTIVDTVAYKNVIVGKEYTITGTLMNKSTGKAITDAEGKAVTSSVKFTAEQTSGSIDVEFTFDASALKNETLVVFEDIYLNGVKVGTHADLNDEDQTTYVPEIHTTALDKTSGTHNMLASKEAVIVDTVAYKNLIIGQTYTVNGTLMDKATGEAIKDADGNAITSSVTFTAEKKNGSIDLEFTFDASALAGTTIVAFESVTTNEKEVGVHADLEDEDQTVYVPEVHTTALDKASATHNILADKDAVIVDTVAYKNLIVGQEYTVTGTLMDKATGEAIKGAEGEDITSSVAFTAETSEGSVDVEFTLDASSLAGKTIVVFETIYIEDKEVGIHADLEDEDQTIYVPEIHTTALDKSSQSHNIIALKDVTIVDTVAYKNVIVGKEYTITGTLMNKSTGKAIADAEGKAVTSSVKFKAEKTSGSIDVEFTFDASALKNETLVVFEDIYLNGVKVGTHADLTDEDQTIYVPEIRTTALDKVTGTHNILAGKNAVIVDTVAYKNLIIGQTYTVNGTLMDKAMGEAIRDAEGNAITSSATFTAEKKDGSIDLEFTFDASALAGTTIVAFESVTTNEKEVGAHADLEDEGQTIYVPQIHTTATDKADGDKKITSSGTVTITDKVEYTNLTVGKEYTVKGVLMDKSTGKELVIDGKTVISEVTFTAETANGSIDMEFTFDATGLKKRDLVVFETVYMDGYEIAVHADLEDEGQTIHMQEKPGTLVPNPGTKTGDYTPVYAVMALLIASFGIISGILMYRHRKAKKGI